MSKKTIVVLGVTGTQGGAVAAKFLQDPTWHVRGVTRNASSPAALSLSAQGIEIVTADLDEPSTLSPVFSGAHAIFGLTDFWAPFFSAYARLSQISDRATGEHAAEMEIRRAKTIVDAAANVLKEEGILETFVYSTLPSFAALSKGKYSFVYHFDCKAEVNKYIAAEQPELHLRTSFLNMGFYCTNLVKYSGLFAPKKEANGSFTIAKPGSNTAIHPFVYPPDAGTLVSLLINSSPGKNLLGVSEMASYETFVKTWSEVVGVPAQVKTVSVEEADKAVPGGLGREAAESTTSSAEFGWGKDLLLPQDIDPNVKLTSLKEYFQIENWEGILNKAS